YDVEQEEMVEVRVRAQDMDGDELEFSWDIGDVLTSPMEGVNYGFNSSSGDLWFIPGDGDVPGFETVVTVTDGQGGEDQFRLIYSVDNINDPPTIIVPAERSTIEGEYLYIVPTFNDPDIDSGDVITFAYDLGELGQRTPSSAIEFTQSNGRLVLKAIAEEMIGEWEVNITVVDFAGLADWGICHVTIGNVNDPPEIFDISIEQQSGNLTVKFHTSEATDEDQGDVLTYMWDFGDGSEPVSGVGLKDIEHEFLSAGAFTVTMKVWDGFAYSEPKELIVTVTAPPPDPDQDKDGIDDDWELRFGFDPNDPLDAVLDADNDGMTNLEEFQYFISTGEYLNPRNPDSDSDGWKDGEEFDRSYDPLNKDEHPDDPNEDWNLLLWIAALASIVLGIGALAAFLFSLMRNRKGARAVPVAAAPIPTSMDQLTNVPYEQMPPADMEALPPAPIVAEDMLPDQTQQYYDQGQSFDQGPVYDQTQQYYDQGQSFDQGPVYDQTQQYNDQDQTFYQAAPDMEQDMGLIGDGQVLPQDPGGSGPGDQGFGPIIEPPVPEVVPADDNVPKEAVVPEGASDVRKDDVETEKEEGPSGLPPIPDLPDI
ncbi:MAG: PKD domain-containing protein, partial [Candidatus Thermoplasmatota archaeon]|nr:PKD domain-containing protein [Candidatus Thermoplasmatota archaeon]